MNERAQSKQAFLQQTLSDGLKALSRGDIDFASKCCRAVLTQQPDLVQGHFLVGLVALEAQQPKVAFSAFQSVVKLQKDHPAAWAHIAKLFMRDGHFHAAGNALEAAESCAGGDAAVNDLIGNVYSMMGYYTEARRCFEGALRAEPDHPAYLQNYANNLVYHGEAEKAERVFLKIIAQHNDSPQAHWALAGARKAQDDAHITAMRQLLEQKNMPPRAQAFYHYAIGKELEDLQQWDAAFSAFSAGARARRATVAFDEQAEQATFDFLQEHYTPKWFASLADGNPDASPIFVLGQPRTGTTLVERIITAHSQVHSAGELQQFGLAVRRLTNYTDPKRFSAALFDGALTVDAEKLGGLYLQSVEKVRGDTPRFVDKLPQNYMMIPLILKALPNAKIVHLTRNPMDACFAGFKQLFADAYLHSYDQREMARHHGRYRKLMDTWRARFPGRFLDIAYEDTARDVESSARKLMAFLELSWEDACLEFHNQKTAVSTASAAQVREPAHTRSIGRWEHYAMQLKPMREELESLDIPVS
ncbi:tetratricopeptide repeat-containing sulfotransferase family protein [Microbulbifer pacificus]|uniref:tetratricopeptide repeat-containing sulfotransferase family protein n=1 Tax=Microbulbifer pacificus TaxID=407164 RepID=UPI000CF3C043|nr:sulfotransferase [Microbulbifer pacificus]